MNARLRLLIEFLLVVAVFAAGIYAFYQYQLLTETQDTLALAEANGTALAETAASDLSNAQMTATQAAAEANSTSTENSNVISSNYATGTWIALVNNANQQRGYATSTQDAENASNTLNSANATSTQAASENSEAQANLAATSSQAAESASNELNNANATSTQAANEASTELAVVYATSTQAADTSRSENEELSSQITTLSDQITDLDNELADTREDMATQRADLETANDTIATQEGEIAILQESSTGNGGNGTGGGTTNTDGLVLVETSRFEIMVFEDYIIVNYEDDDYEDALDEIRDLGEGFETIADFLEDNVSGAELTAVLDDNSNFEIMSVYVFRESREVPLEDVVEDFEDGLEDADFDIESSEILELGGQEVARIFSTTGSRSSDLAQVEYIVQDGRNYWLIEFLTSFGNAEDRLEDFDASVATFRVQ